MRPAQTLRIVVVMLIAILLVASSASMLAQSRSNSSTKPAAESKEKDVVDARADNLKSVWGAKKFVVMTGNVRFKHGDSVLTSDQVDYDQDEKVAVSPGKFSLTNPECDLTADKGTAYFKKKLTVVEGNVVMILKPKPEEVAEEDKESVREKLKKPTTITCPKMEYQYKDKVATCTGGVDFRQEKRTARADTAVYDQNKELLTLTGNVKGTDEDGQTFSAPGKVVISIKKGDEWMEAPNAQATFKIDLDEEED